MMKTYLKPIGVANALPFWLSLSLLPVAAVGASLGGWAVLLVPLVTWYLFTLLDLLTGLNEENADPNTGESQLFWYRAVTLIWAPIQFAFIYGMLFYVCRAGHLALWEKFALFFGVGVVSGVVGVTYAHELVHQRNRTERQLGDLLLAMVLYGHWRSEHLFVHHRYVGTPRDPESAPLGEGFWRFLPRVVWHRFAAACRAESELLARKRLPWWHRANPFWSYAALQGAMLALALIVGGWLGVALFTFQAAVAVWQLELVGYVEHYGLARRHLGNGKYEHVQPHHSWNADHRGTNWLLINLQRHSDHHARPDRRFPLLQTYSQDAAPQLPHGYPVMSTIALVPPLWRRFMDPRVLEWRTRHYPDIEDWSPVSLSAAA